MFEKAIASSNLDKSLDTLGFDLNEKNQIKLFMKNLKLGKGLNGWNYCEDKMPEPLSIVDVAMLCTDGVSTSSYHNVSFDGKDFKQGSGILGNVYAWRYDKIPPFRLDDKRKYYITNEKNITK